jgi:hypothetical protein
MESGGLAEIEVRSGRKVLVVFKESQDLPVEMVRRALAVPRGRKVPQALPAYRAQKVKMGNLVHKALKVRRELRGKQVFQQLEIVDLKACRGKAVCAELLELPATQALLVKLDSQEHLVRREYRGHVE